ncbi:MAG: DUF4387 family protein [Pseudomonadota bacterium]
MSASLGDLVLKVRSKNAGPFWLTIDIFCGDAFQEVSARLDTGQVAAWLSLDAAQIKRFDIEDLQVIKLSFPRPVTQGHAADRDMHGAGMAPLLAEMEI